MIEKGEMIRLIFGFKIKHLRISQGKSYKELAEETGLSTSYLNDIEKGKKYPKAEKIGALAEALGTDYDYLVSMQADKKLSAVIEFLNSDFFRSFPLEEFGFSLEKVLDIFTTSPHKINAFLTTIMKLVRSYRMDQSHFYRVALRSFQDIHDNYFPDLELSAKQCKRQHNLKPDSLSPAYLKKVLIEEYHYKINEEAIGQHAELQGTRSHFSASSKTLYLNPSMSQEQTAFVLARELGYAYLQLPVRPYTLIKLERLSFQQLLHNFKASYFAAALLMDEETLVEDISQIARRSNWHAGIIGDLLAKYKVTPETLLQRFTNILPHHFGINDLFFIRLKEGQDAVSYSMTKELQLSKLHKPHRNELNEHLCQRWVSITAIKKVKASKKEIDIDAQISNYWQTHNAYFCITAAQKSSFSDEKAYSITLGMLINDKLRANFNFLNDPKLKQRTVHTTCERCSIPDCESRVANPVQIEAQAKHDAHIEALKNLT